MRTGGRDPPRLCRERPAGAGAGSGARGHSALRLPRGAPAPQPPGRGEGRRSGAEASRALPSRLPDPAPPQHAAPGLRSRVGVGAEAASAAAAGPERRAFGSRGAAAGRPISAAMAPVPVAAGARRLRHSPPRPRSANPSARPAGRPRAGHRRPRLAAPASRLESPGQRPAPSRPRRPQDPPSIGPRGCQSAPKRRAGCRSACPDWWPLAVHANEAPPPFIGFSASPRQPTCLALALCGGHREGMVETDTPSQHLLPPEKLMPKQAS